MTAAFQREFGLLLVHRPSRERFLASAAEYTRDLDGETAALLRGLVAEDVEAAADNLVLKRAGHVRQMIPELSQVLGTDLLPLFRRHAEMFLIAGPEKHSADAWMFLKGLCEHPSADVRTLAQTWLTRLARTRRLHVERQGILPQLSLRELPWWSFRRWVSAVSA